MTGAVNKWNTAPVAVGVAGGWSNAFIFCYMSLAAFAQALPRHNHREWI